jgi:hypothetical protein
MVPGQTAFSQQRRKVITSGLLYIVGMLLGYKVRKFLWALSFSIAHYKQINDMTSNFGPYKQTFDEKYCSSIAANAILPSAHILS